MNLPLPGGEQATLRDRLSYGQARSVRLAFLAMKVDPLAMAELDIALVRAYVVNWTVTDVDGNPVPLDTPELAADAAIQDISIAAMNIWKGKAPDPKDGKRHSATTPRGRG